MQGRKAEERRTAEERGPPANETALVLEDRLGAAQREDARQGPARQRHHAIARARGEEKRVVGNARRPFTASEIEDALMRRPGQRLGTVVDAAPEASEEGVETAVSPRLRAHQWRHVEAEARGRRAVALPADLPALVDQNRPQPRLGEHRCGPNAGGPAADNDDPRHGRSSLGGSDVQTAIAGAASVVHARTRRPVSDPNPAVLTGTHQAKSGTRRPVGLQPPHDAAARQQRGDQAVAQARIDGHAVHRELDRGAIPAHGAHELSAGFRGHSFTLRIAMR